MAHLIAWPARAPLLALAVRPRAVAVTVLEASVLTVTLCGRGRLRGGGTGCGWRPGLRRLRRLGRGRLLTSNQEGDETDCGDRSKLLHVSNVITSARNRCTDPRDLPCRVVSARRVAALQNEVDDDDCDECGEEGGHGAYSFADTKSKRRAIDGPP
jgi:hypothetical protein